MSTTTVRRPLGQILRDGGLLSQLQLQQALEEQQRTNELLGKVLVRMGVLGELELKAALSLQGHLGSLEQAVRLSAGVREMLGSLLVRAGQISGEQLDLAIAEQRRRGGKLGDVCVGLGFLTRPQLDGLLSFQRQQGLEGRPAHPLRLGELLVAAGEISREQLDDALRKQALSRKKLGQVLVEEGYARRSQVSRGLRLQKLLMGAVLAAVLSLASLSLSGCGGSGSSATEGPVAASSPSSTTAWQAAGADYFVMTSDDYGLIKPNFYYSTDNETFWSIQANVAKSASDVDSRDVFRIDVPKSAPLPSLNQTFSLEEGGRYPKFPGSFLVFNGEKSSNKKVESGAISFSPDSSWSGKVNGSFDVTLTDYDANALPAPRYHLKGSFNFEMGSYAPAASNG